MVAQEAVGLLPPQHLQPARLLSLPYLALHPKSRQECCSLCISCHNVAARNVAYVTYGMCVQLRRRCSLSVLVPCWDVFSNRLFTAEVLAQGKNVKSIIDDWNNELNAHSRAFVADAQSLAEWDQHIRRKRRELLEMEAHLNRVHLQQHLLSTLNMHRNAGCFTM